MPQISPKRLAFFERYLTVWVGLCMVLQLELRTGNRSAQILNP